MMWLCYVYRKLNLWTVLVIDRSATYIDVRYWWFMTSGHFNSCVCRTRDCDSLPSPNWPPADQWVTPTSLWSEKMKDGGVVSWRTCWFRSIYHPALCWTNLSPRVCDTSTSLTTGHCWSSPHVTSLMTKPRDTFDIEHVVWRHVTTSGGQWMPRENMLPELTAWLDWVNEEGKHVTGVDCLCHRACINIVLATTCTAATCLFHWPSAIVSRDALFR